MFFFILKIALYFLKYFLRLLPLIFKRYLVPLSKADNSVNFSRLFCQISKCILLSIHDAWFIQISCTNCYSKNSNCRYFLISLSLFFNFHNEIQVSLWSKSWLPPMYSLLKLLIIYKQFLVRKLRELPYPFPHPCICDFLNRDSGKATWKLIKIRGKNHTGVNNKHTITFLLWKWCKTKQKAFKRAAVIIE